MATTVLSMTPGNCEQCRKPFRGDRFALWYDHGQNKRSCQHLVCGTCRGIMPAWRKPHCPNSKCGKPFYAIQDALSPGAASTQEFFEYVNYSQTGRIDKEELAAWFTTNFSMSQEAAMGLICSKWHLWDVPKNHHFLKAGWFRAPDQGDLDVGEFPPLLEFMKECLAQSLASTATTPPAPLAREAIEGSAATQPAPSDEHGLKRKHSEADALAQGIARNVAQRKLTQSEELQSKLSNDLDKGREWFDHFDTDKSNSLDKGELIDALLHTFMGNIKITKEKIISIVDAVWVAIDIDGSGSVCFDEFQMLREAVVAQLCYDRVARAVASITAAPQ